MPLTRVSSSKVVNPGSLFWSHEKTTHTHVRQDESNNKDSFFDPEGPTDLRRSRKDLHANSHKQLKQFPGLVTQPSNVNSSTILIFKDKGTDRPSTSSASLPSSPRDPVFGPCSTYRYSQRGARRPATARSPRRDEKSTWSLADSNQGIESPGKARPLRPGGRSGGLFLLPGDKRFHSSIMQSEQRAPWCPCNAVQAKETITINNKDRFLNAYRSPQCDFYESQHEEDWGNYTSTKSKYVGNEWKYNSASKAREQLKIKYTLTSPEDAI